MERKNMDAVHRLSKSEDWAVFAQMIKQSGDKYVAKIFEIDPKLSETNFSMKDLFVFYTRFCEHCVNLPQQIVQEFVEGGLDGMDNKDLDEYVDNIVDSVMQEAQKFVKN